MLNKVKLTTLGFVIVLILYNFLVLMIGGINDHTVTFWFSYAIENISFIIVGVLLGVCFYKGVSEKLFFLGYPIALWSCIYLPVQLIVSIIFMCVDRYAKAAITIQMLLLVSYIFIVIMCMQAKNAIEDVYETRSANIYNMRYMITIMDSIVPSVSDVQLRNKLHKLAEDLRYSDVVSSVATEALEKQMMEKIDLLKVKSKNAPGDASILAVEISEQLAERNFICKESKKRY